MDLDAIQSHKIIEKVGSLLFKVCTVYIDVALFNVSFGVWMSYSSVPWTWQAMVSKPLGTDTVEIELLLFLGHSRSSRSLVRLNRHRSIFLDYINHGEKIKSMSIVAVFYVRPKTENAQSWIDCHNWTACRICISLAELLREMQPLAESPDPDGP